MEEKTNLTAPTETEQDLNEILKVRRAKLEALKASGNDPFFKVRYDRTALSADIKYNYEKYEGQTVGIAGRLISKRWVYICKRLISTNT